MKWNCDNAERTAVEAPIAPCQRTPTTVVSGAHMGWLIGLHGDGGSGE
jgi:hypothetical protein